VSGIQFQGNIEVTKTGEEPSASTCHTKQPGHLVQEWWRFIQ